MNRKVAQYLRSGALEVWLVFLEEREVHVWRKDGPLLLKLPAVLDGGTVLPGFRLPLSDLFAGL